MDKKTCITTSFHYSHRTSLTQLHFIEVPVPSQGSKRSCLCYPRLITLR